MSKEKLIEVKDDLNMISPICYITKSINWLIGKVFNNFKISLMVYLIAYVIAVTVVNIPMLDFTRMQKIYVSVSILGLPLCLFLAYIFIGMVLLALFASNPKTRLSYAIILIVIALFPFMVIAMADTRLLLIFGVYLSAALIVINMIMLPNLAYKYRERLIKHAYLCMPVILSIVAFTWFESSQGFSYGRIDRENFTTSDHQRVVPVSKSGAQGTPFYTCDVFVNFNGYQYEFQDMIIPSNGHIEYIEVRQAVFQHFQLR
ncbi:hypothetical protein H5232_18385 [Pseudoalteromonas sp. SG41-5]|uniref:hypothetical protein n=1 Tax=Pseudoalteromonas sp. SG41-5 TaxID=2760975 RepID=UPI00160213BA|nr:hypothetical protein [Pseudoalteromonas sp. SG41-5]MBB1470396.1 hypothetical protein [Pseudoalteromonas sp. SG41-5]